MEEKSYRNKELMLSQEDFHKSITNDFVGDDFIEQLEWAMLMIQGKFKQMRYAEHLPPISANTFDKAYLMSATLNDDNLKFLHPFTTDQATPEIFPNINYRYMNITDSVQMVKVKELDFKQKRMLKVKKKYAYEIAYAVFKKDTESFYGLKNGYELNPGFFKAGGEKIEIDDLPCPISLHPNYTVPDNSWKYLSKEEIIDIYKQICFSYQAVLSMYYEWSIYIKEYDNIGLVVPIEPGLLSEIYKSSMLKFESKKKMLHFVRDHYRRKVALLNEDYSVYVNKYLRGEHKFDYRGFYTEIIPPKYDLNRVKTRKKFIDATA